MDLSRFFQKRIYQDFSKIEKKRNHSYLETRNLINTQHTPRRMSVKTTPFFAQLPSLLYEQDRRNPSYMRFKEARAVRLRKEFHLQLRTEDFRELSRCFLVIVLDEMRVCRFEEFTQTCVCAII